MKEVVLYFVLIYTCSADVLRLRTKNEHWTYTFFPLFSNYIKFSLKAKSDAIIILTQQSFDTPPCYEIIIGANENTVSGIRKDMKQELKTWFQGPIITDTAYTDFWFEKDQNSISLGYNGSRVPILTYTDKEFHFMRFFGFGTYGVEGDWIFDSDFLSKNQQIDLPPKTVLTLNNPELNLPIEIIVRFSTPLQIPLPKSTVLITPNNLTTISIPEGNTLNANQTLLNFELGALIKFPAEVSLDTVDLNSKEITLPNNAEIHLLDQQKIDIQTSITADITTDAKASYENDVTLNLQGGLNLIVPQGMVLNMLQGFIKLDNGGVLTVAQDVQLKLENDMIAIPANSQILINDGVITLPETKMSLPANTTLVVGDDSTINIPPDQLMQIPRDSTFSSAIDSLKVFHKTLFALTPAYDGCYRFNNTFIIPDDTNITIEESTKIPLGENSNINISPNGSLVIINVIIANLPENNILSIPPDTVVELTPNTTLPISGQSILTFPENITLDDIMASDKVDKYIRTIDSIDPKLINKPNYIVVPINATVPPNSITKIPVEEIEYKMVEGKLIEGENFTPLPDVDEDGTQSNIISTTLPNSGESGANEIISQPKNVESLGNVRVKDKSEEEVLDVEEGLLAQENEEPTENYDTDEYDGNPSDEFGAYNPKHEASIEDSNEKPKPKKPPPVKLEPENPPPVAPETEPTNPPEVAPEEITEDTNKDQIKEEPVAEIEEPTERIEIPFDSKNSEIDNSAPKAETEKPKNLDSTSDFDKPEEVEFVRRPYTGNKDESGDSNEPKYRQPLLPEPCKGTDSSEENSGPVKTGAGIYTIYALNIINNDNNWI